MQHPEILLNEPASPSSSDRFSTPVLVSRHTSRTSSPFVDLVASTPVLHPRPPLTVPRTHRAVGHVIKSRETDGEQLGHPADFENWDDDEEEDDEIYADPVNHTDSEDDDDDDEVDETAPIMPSDLKSTLRAADRPRPQTPLLGSSPRESTSPRTPAVPAYGNISSPLRPPLSRRSTMHERDPEVLRQSDQRKRWLLAGFFLILSLVSFTVQTETAVYIQHHLGWKKPFCMLYVHTPQKYIICLQANANLLHAHCGLATLNLHLLN